MRFDLFTAGLTSAEYVQARRWLAHVFAHFAVSDNHVYYDSPEPPFRFGVRCERSWSFDGWRLSVYGSGPISFLIERSNATQGASLASVLPDFEIAIINYITERLPGKLWVHGACLEHEGNLVVLVGPSGVGKTTLSLGLLGRGFKLLTDDVIVFDIDTAMFVPFLRCPKFRPPATELLNRIGLPVERIASYLGRYVLLNDEVVMKRPQAVKGASMSVVFLHNDPGGKSEGVCTMTLSSAIIEISRFSNLMYRDPDLSLFKSVFAEGHFYRLRVGDLATNIRHIIGMTGVH